MNTTTAVTPTVPPMPDDLFKFLHNYSSSPDAGVCFKMWVSKYIASRSRSLWPRLDLGSFIMYETLLVKCENLSGVDHHYFMVYGENVFLMFLLRSIHTERFRYGHRNIDGRHLWRSKVVPPVNVTVTVAKSLSVNGPLMVHIHCTGPGPGQGPGNDGFLHYTHYTGVGTGAGNHCFLLCPSRCLSLSQSRTRALCMSHKTVAHPGALHHT